MLLGIYNNFPATDIWSLGCILYYLVQNKLLFQQTLVDKQLNSIFKKLGCYDDLYESTIYVKYQYKTNIKSNNVNIQDLINKLLNINYNTRIKIKEVYEHNLFK